MKCAFCGMEYTSEQGQAACRGCPLARGCGMLRCPRCGYETPAEPGIFKRLRQKNGKSKNGTARTG